MKRTLIIFIVIIIIYLLIGNVIAKDSIIPDEAIRVRIIANSNSDYDQKIKNKVKNEVEYEMYEMLKDTKEIVEARELIKENLSSLENNVYTLLQKEDYKLPFTINFGLNYFPKKQFKGIMYNDGYYESIVITLGEGLGDNWWCVLFPPLCMIEAEESTELEYTTMVGEIINKYFHK